MEINQQSKARMHCQDELECDLGYEGLLSDETLLKWYRDFYSTSKHLLVLYSLVIGVKAKYAVEVGFGRSSFVLLKALHDSNGILHTCDRRDFSYLLSAVERENSIFYQEDSSQFIPQLKEGIDFCFLDHFSNPGYQYDACKNEIIQIIEKLSSSGILAIHDPMKKSYQFYHVLEELSNDNGLEQINLSYNYGLCILKKRKSLLPSDYSDPWPKKTPEII